MDSEKINADFEKNYALAELLPAQSRAKIKSALIACGLSAFDLLDLKNNSLLANKNDNCDQKLPLTVELEPIGYLCFRPEHSKIAQSVSLFLTLLMQTNWRYQMASSLHLDVVQADFDELTLKHQQLLTSEQKYKSLSENLELRVKQQLTQIEESQRQLYEAEKMASIGQLAAGVAHEINNPIGFISSNLNSGIEYLADLERFMTPVLSGHAEKIGLQKSEQDELRYIMDDFSQLLSESLSGARRVSAIVSDLKAFSNVDHTESVYLDLKQDIERVARIFLTSVNKKVKLETEIESVEKTYCKPGHLNQLLLNLLHNAEEAIKETGSIKLSCKMFNGQILLEVKDSGKGMSEETLRKAFEPFYTTREVGSGTGLGLTVSRDIVSAHQGKIDIKSKLDVGTCIQILLPVLSAP